MTLQVRHSKLKVSQRNDPKSGRAFGSITYHVWAVGRQSWVGLIPIENRGDNSAKPVGGSCEEPVVN